MHSQGVIHRDIKSANLLLKNESDIVITDFGVSVHNINCTSICNSKQLNGTLNWMAPELLLGEKYDCRVDTWSMGCTILEMLTGNVPFPDLYYLDARSDLELIFYIDKVQIISKTKYITISDDMWNFLKQIMVIDWKKRPTCQEIYDNIHLYPWLSL